MLCKAEVEKLFHETLTLNATNHSGQQEMLSLPPPNLLEPEIHIRPRFRGFGFKRLRLEKGTVYKHSTHVLFIAKRGPTGFPLPEKG